MTDEKEPRTTRRSVLKATAGVGTGIGALGATPEPASAYDLSDVSRTRAGIRRLAWRLAKRALDKQHWPMLARMAGVGTRRKHPNVPGYTYVTSIHAGDLCFVAGTACWSYGVVGGYTKTLPEYATVGAGCALGVGSYCTLRTLVRRYTECEYEYTHIYVPGFWKSIKGDNRFILVPDCVDGSKL